eukprot:scaffold27940_cov32-Tisochrysis_lutea.AAC.4
MLVTPSPVILPSVCCAPQCADPLNGPPGPGPPPVHTHGPQPMSPGPSSSLPTPHVHTMAAKDPQLHPHHHCYQQLRSCGLRLRGHLIGAAQSKLMQPGIPRRYRLAWQPGPRPFVLRSSPAALGLSERMTGKLD